MGTPRDIKLNISLSGGQRFDVRMSEDAPELLTLFSALSTPQLPSRFVQLPLEGGRIACSFQTSQVVAIVSEPPVVLNLEPAADLVTSAADPVAPQVRTTRTTRTTHVRPARHVVIDDFLSAQEHDEILSFALLSEHQFQKGTVTTYEPDVRQNLVILNFGETPHSRLIENRLLTWFPLVAKSLGMPAFPLADVESQLTAAVDGYYFKVHSDEAPEIPRILTCLYYLHREPRGFAGGDLRLYDSIVEDGVRTAADTFTAVSPAANRLVVFPSEEYHEAMPVRCPSRDFADSRFAVTTWLHRATQPQGGEAKAGFGWGHLHCGGLVPPAAAI